MFLSLSIIFSVDLEVALGMSAGGADLRSGSSYHDMSAVAALPNLDLALLEYLSGLNVVKKRAVSLLVMLLNVETAEVFKKSSVKVWECRNCGHIVVGTEAPEVCPTCAHPQSYFELHAENY